jgi:hypothetical protein
MQSNTSYRDESPHWELPRARDCEGRTHDKEAAVIGAEIGACDDNVRHQTLCTPL